MMAILQRDHLVVVVVCPVAIQMYIKSVFWNITATFCVRENEIQISDIQ